MFPHQPSWPATRSPGEISPVLLYGDGATAGGGRGSGRAGVAPGISVGFCTGEEAGTPRAISLADDVRRVADEALPLTPQQRDWLSDRMRSAAGAVGSARPRAGVLKPLPTVVSLLTPAAAPGLARIPGRRLRCPDLSSSAVRPRRSPGYAVIRKGQARL